MGPEYLDIGLYSALAAVLAYCMVLSNRSIKSLEKHFEQLETAFVIPLCGGNYEENIQLAREMGHPEIAEKIEEISGKTLKELLD